MFWSCILGKQFLLNSVFSPHTSFIFCGGKKAVVSNMPIFNYMSSTDNNVRNIVFFLLFMMLGLQIGDCIHDA